jgi:CheY-like chemotaxis protein
MRILLIDDDADDQALFAEAILEIDPGIEVETANNGEEALQRLFTGTRPHLIFLDINMPLMDGKTCLRKIRQDNRFGSVPVVIISTSIIPQDVPVFSALDAEHMTKPNRFGELVEMLQAFIAPELVVRNVQKTEQRYDGFAQS